MARPEPAEVRAANAQLADDLPARGWVGSAATGLSPRAVAHWDWLGRVVARVGVLTTQPVERGTLPQLYAATAPGVRGGQFFGPSGFMEMRGRVTEVPPSAEAADPVVGWRLWSVAEELTGVSYL